MDLLRRQTMYAATPRRRSATAPKRLPVMMPASLPPLSPEAGGAAVGIAGTAVPEGSAVVAPVSRPDVEDSVKDCVEDSVEDSVEPDAVVVVESEMDRVVEVRLVPVSEFVSDAVGDGVAVGDPIVVGSVSVCTASVIGSVMDSRSTVVPVATDRTVVASCDAVPQPN